MDDEPLDRPDVRIRNFLRREDFPYTQVTGAILDSGDYEGTLRSALELIDYGSFRERQAQARAEGRFIGIGFGQELTPEGAGSPGSLWRSVSRSMGSRTSSVAASFARATSVRASGS